MASSSNGNGNLMDEFEEAFQTCLHALTKQECNTGVTKEEIELEVQQSANKFIDVARQMEAFFLQKRFLISTLKPEMLIKDENQELRYEITRKDVLINKHYARLEEWKSLLSDMQQQKGYNKLIPPQADLRPTSHPGIPISSGNQMNFMGNTMSGPLQAQMQQQHMQAQQQQQQQIIPNQQMHQIQQMQIEKGQQVYLYDSLLPFRLPKISPFSPGEDIRANITKRQRRKNSPRGRRPKKYFVGFNNKK